jgi:hypothetical protein
MTRGFKRAMKGAGIAVGAMIVCLVLAVGVLTTPGPFFPEEKQYGSITVHSETPIDEEVDSVVAEVIKRLEHVPIYDPHMKLNLCLCSTQSKFTFFARLTRRANRIMGFSLLNSVYVNGDYLRELAFQTGGQPRYSAREGSVVHVATHELMHCFLADAAGNLSSRMLPEWKVEGYCEYGCNQFVAPRDSGYSINDRINIYLDDTRWNAISVTHRPHYLWGLMVEYLVNEQGLSFEQVMADSVTRELVYREMMEWRGGL